MISSAPPLLASATDGLRTGVHGPVLVPGDAAYEAEAAGFQRAQQHRPAVIVGAARSADVVAAVQFAAEGGLPCGVQSTGHGLSVPLDGGVLISTPRMDGVTVDPDAGTARIEAGARWQTVIERAAAHGLAPLSGSAPHVGAVGYTLGGGLGLLARRYGYAADHVRSASVVTADGRYRRVDPARDADLFWALRGGRDNFGIVTDLTVDLVPVDRIVGGGLYFDGQATGDLRRVLAAYRAWTATLPDELTSSLGIVPFRDLATVPAAVRGRRAVHVRVAYLGCHADADELLAPLRAAGSLLLDTVDDMPWTSSGEIFADPVDPHGYRGRSALVTDLDEPAVRAVAELGGPGAPVRCIVDVRHLGGALSASPAVPNAVGHRRARYLVRVLSPTGRADPEAIRCHHDRFAEALAPTTVGQSINFCYGEPPEGTRPFYGEDDHRRLAALKAVHDPGNVFRAGVNIEPVPRPRSGSTTQPEGVRAPADDPYTE